MFIMWLIVNKHVCFLISALYIYIYAYVYIYRYIHLKELLSQPGVELNESRTNELMARWRPKNSWKSGRKQFAVIVKIHKIFQKEGSVSSVNAIRTVKQDEDWLCAMEVITGLTKASEGTNILGVSWEPSGIKQTIWNLFESSFEMEESGCLLEEK